MALLYRFLSSKNLKGYRAETMSLPRRIYEEASD
jgi:hypothetical protein